MCVYVAKAVNESSADSGRDTLGTTSGELVTCSNPNSSVASSLDSNSNVQPPTPSGANQPLGDGVGSRVRSSTPAFSSPSPKPAELCQLQPHKSTRLPQHHTPVRQLFTAAKNLQRYTGGILCEHALISIILYAEMDIIFFGYHFFLYLTVSYIAFWLLRIFNILGKTILAFFVQQSCILNYNTLWIKIND